MIVFDVLSAHKITSPVLYRVLKVFIIVIIAVTVIMFLFSGAIGKMFDPDVYKSYKFYYHSVFFIAAIIAITLYMLWVPAKSGNISISDEGFTISLPAGSRTMKINELDSILFVHCGLKVRIGICDGKTVSSSIIVRDKKGEIYIWNIFIPDRDILNQLYVRLEEIEEDYGIDITIENISGSTSKLF